MDSQRLDLDLHRLELRFADTRLVEPGAVARIADSIERCGQGVHVERVSVPGPNGVNLDAALVLPKGTAKAPPVVGLHGCGGPFPSRDGQWAVLLAQAGHILTRQTR